ncbi:MAG TPA: SAM-dependent methyltransferase [Ferruginibacter sp.]|nr:SAM-dependent methyltransferase [Ferruginibacter sp.]
MLRDIIIKKIQTGGPLSFHDFQEMCLYYPELGYYTSSKEKIGTGGDFYTSATVTPAFGAMIARQLEEMWECLGKDNFIIVEYGAGTGALCHDILETLKKNEAFYNNLQYVIIEKSPTLAALQQSRLNEKVSWKDSINDIAPFNGCVFCNELLDNFSVHQVVMQDKLMEVFVDYDNGFKEFLLPAGEALINYFRELNIVLAKGFRTEVNLEAIEWINEIAGSLEKGFVCTIDYGDNATNLYRESRKDGTMLCYYKHNRNEEPYERIGEQDITSHVNFTAIALWGKKAGLDVAGFTSQSNFLQGLGFTEYLNQSAAGDMHALATMSRVKYSMLVDMGMKFKVLIHSKGIEKKELMGLQYPGLSL